MRSLATWRRRILLAALLVLVVAVGPALASPTAADYIDGRRNKLLAIAIPGTIATEAALYYAVKRHRNNDDSKSTVENRRLEVTWTLATAAVQSFVGPASYGVMAQPAVMSQFEDPEPDRGDVTVDVEAYQFGWNFYDPQHENVSTDTKIVLPVDTRVFFSVTSRDVVNSFSASEMGLKQDAFPGDEDVILTRTTEQGSFQGYCTEFCGINHAGMTFVVEVVSGEEYQSWLNEQEQRPGEARS